MIAWAAVSVAVLAAIGALVTPPIDGKAATPERATGSSSSTLVSVSVPTDARAEVETSAPPVEAAVATTTATTAAETVASTTVPEATTPATTRTSVAPTSTVPVPAVDDVAECNDNTYSDNTNFHGTCSQHHGVKRWLADFGECQNGKIIEMGADADCGDGGFARLRPDYSPPAPTVPVAGPEDIAQCQDGAFSDNTDFGATCSSHDGVKAWLAPYGECADGFVIEINASASCDGHLGFKGLLPVDYQPVVPAANTPCTTLQARAEPALACVATGFGPLWVPAPFALPDDQIALLPGEPSETANLQVNAMGITAAALKTVTSYGETYWCASIGLKNFSDDVGFYNLFDFALLTTTGNIESATIPLANGLDALLSSGQLSPEGYASGLVCFDQPSGTAGRFAIIYDPLSIFDDTRAIYYFDH